MIDFAFKVIFYHFYARGHLERLLTKKLSRRGFSFQTAFSGKVALYRIARLVFEKSGNNLALIPDYICNVVNIALEKAGFRIVTYPTDAFLETTRTKLLAEVESKRPGLLLCANVFGSSASLPFLHDAEFSRQVQASGTHVIVDICQDISLLDELPCQWGENLSAIVSFNSKSFPGAIGGGLLTKELHPISGKALPVRKKIALYHFLFRQWRDWKRKKTSPHFHSSDQQAQSYEYAYCTTFPYIIEEYIPTKIQLIMALLGLRRLNHYLRKRAAFLHAAKLNFQPMHYQHSAPYLIVLPGTEPEIPSACHHRQKPTYATHGHPTRSVHPDWIIIHNKGFWDD